MMFNREQSLAAGDNSINNQANTVIQHITNIEGCTKEEAREILLQIFHDNMPRLAHEARKIADERANQLTDKLIEAMMMKSPNLLDSFRDPDMQYSLANAQIAHARLGDDNLADIMIDVLVERAAQTTRTLPQIVLNEVISVLPRLTANQINILSLIFLIKYTTNTGLLDIQSLRNYFSEHYLPLLSSISKESSCYQHLAYSSCGAISIGGITIEAIYRNNYPGLFSKGFSLESFKEIDNSHESEQVLINCLHDRLFYQVNGLSKEDITQRLKSVINDPEKVTKVITLHESTLMSEQEVKEFLLSMHQWVSIIFDYWDNSMLKNMTLTSVGIAIAISNIRRKISKNIDMSIWIK